MLTTLPTKSDALPITPPASPISSLPSTPLLDYDRGGDSRGNSPGAWFRLRYEEPLIIERRDGCLTRPPDGSAVQQGNISSLESLDHENRHSGVGSRSGRSSQRTVMGALSGSSENVQGRGNVCTEVSLSFKADRKPHQNPLAAPQSTWPHAGNVIRHHKAHGPTP